MAIVILCLAAPAVRGNAVGRFGGRLSPVPVDVAMLTTVTGSGSVSATLTERTLTVSGTFTGLRAPATTVGIYRAFRGLRGPKLFDLQATHETAGTITGRVSLTSPQVEDLQQSMLFVQLHSESAPEGNLRGWLMPREGGR
jgi:hypothetical protein